MTLDLYTAGNALHGVNLAVQSPSNLAAFYVTHLGMEARQVGANIHLTYPGSATALILSPAHKSQPYEPSVNDRYWKIGITLPDLDHACRDLCTRGVAVSPPIQFENIGYMAHLNDPEGFKIELLQHTFQGQDKKTIAQTNIPLGGGCRLAHITLRTTNIDRETAHFVHELGMKLLSIQPLPAYGFDLYFFAYTNELPPQSDLLSVQNRPWLWQRPYTCIELQHLHHSDTQLLFTDAGSAGFVELVIS